MEDKEECPIWDIKEQIFAASQMLNIPFRIMEDASKESIISSVMEKYCKVKSHWPIWEKFSDFVGVSNKDAWQWIEEFVGSNKCILFFNPSDEKRAYLFESGQHVVSVIEELFNVEFYVTNEATDYLLCFNHHDCLMALGNAIDWLDTRG
ncbi:DUF6756 family protein [Brevibacillus gelatini]|nr:DUF6756 family protein [Brevibacillus gelatini]